MSSAVAPAHTISSVADPVLGLAKAGRSAHEIEAAEMSRWMIWFGTPVLIASIFVGITFGTGHELWLSGSLISIMLDIFVLIWLALSSDTNGVIGEISHH